MKHIGTIVVAAAGTKNNKDTATSFDIAKKSRIAIQSDTAGVYAELGIGAAFTTDVNKGRKLAVDAWVEIDLADIETVLSIHNPTGGEAKVKVFSLWRR